MLESTIVALVPFSEEMFMRHMVSCLAVLIFAAASALTAGAAPDGSRPAPTSASPTPCRVYQAVKDAVVNISSTRIVTAPRGHRR